MTAELNVQDYIAVQQLYADYGLTLDRGDFDHWPDFFMRNAWSRLCALFPLINLTNHATLAL